MADVEQIVASILSKGEEIRALKAATPATLKDDLAPLVQELLNLKLQYKEVTGEEYGPAKEEPKKKEAVTQEKKSDGPSKSELNKLKRKEQKAAKKAEAKAANATEESEAPESSSTKSNASTDENDQSVGLYGDSPMIQSAVVTERIFRNIAEINEDLAGQTVWIRARLATSRAVGKGIFILLRQQVNTVQGVLWQGKEVSKAMVKYGAGISLESVIDVRAEVIKAETPVQSATIKAYELSIKEIHVVSRAQDLPFLVEDAGRNEAEAVANNLPVVNQDTALNFRWVDTRTPANQAIFRIQSGVCMLFREFLTARGFVEIHSPKLIGGASEGGANVFTLKYFDQPACLAQSPQFYKQMTAACGGFERVFEIGPVFRAEDSNTHRYFYFCSEVLLSNVGIYY
jgi:aspartyl-tRNA synthetase